MIWVIKTLYEDQWLKEDGTLGIPYQDFPQIFPDSALAECWIRGQKTIEEPLKPSFLKISERELWLVCYAERLKAHCRKVSTAQERAIFKDGRVVGYWQDAEWIATLVRIYRG